MTHKIIFLDIDGVLNRSTSPMAGRYFPCEPENVACLNRLLAVTGAGLVITSDWRRLMSWDTLCAVLTRRGVCGDFVGKTPSLDRDGPFGRRPVRGHEVDAWIREERFEGEFVILDDRGDLEPHGHRLVRTLPEFGLVEADVERAVGLFGGRLGQGTPTEGEWLGTVSDGEL